MRIAVISLKGGAGKTTAAVNIAAALAERGERVTLIDADAQGSALAWSEAIDAPWQTIALPTAASLNLRAHTYTGAVVIDTPPGHPDIAEAALAACDVALIPVQPTPADLNQYTETRALVRASGKPAVVLLTRVVARTIAARETRELIDTASLPVLPSVVAQSQAAAMAFGQPIKTPGIYADILTELEEAAR